jgi:hypothetical protein
MSRRSVVVRKRTVTSGIGSPLGASVSALAGTASTAIGSPGDNESRILAVLDGREPHFSYSMPADPVTTQEVTVTTAAQFNAYAGQSPTTGTAGGWRITISDSFSGNVTINANDIDVVMSNSATISGSLTISPSSSPRRSRIRWTGGNVTGGVTVEIPNDLLLDDFRSVSAISMLVWEPARFALINSTISMSGGGNFALFLSPVATRFDHVVIGNSIIEHTGGGQTSRIQNVHSLLIVGSVFNPTGSVNGFRMHYACNNVWVRDTWVRNGINLHQANPDDSGPSVTNALFDNFDAYADDPGFDPFYSNSSGITNSNTGTLQNSALYRTRGSGIASVANFVDGGGNTGEVWDGVTLPDYSGVGAVR